jgi:carbonic anhydrase/acetyltransferase-like protein (isoleucine patch superfamily)
MIKSFSGKTPKIADSVFISETANVIDEVEIDDYSVVAAGCLVRGKIGGKEEEDKT